MNKSLLYSIILHFFIIIISYFGLPSLAKKYNKLDDNSFTVSILPISQTTNLKTIEKIQKIETKPKPEPKKEIIASTEPKKALPEPKIKKIEEKIPVPKIAKPVIKEIEPKIKKKPKIEPKVTKAPPIPKIKKTDPEIVKIPPKPKLKQIEKVAKVEFKEKIEKKITPKPKIKKKVIPKNVDFESVLKSIEDDKIEEKQLKKFDLADIESQLEIKANDNLYDEKKPLSISQSRHIKNLIKNKIYHNWTIPAGIKDAKDQTVNLTLHFYPTGKLKSIDFEDKLRYSVDFAFRAAVDAAKRAAWKSAPFDNLPIDQYDNGWKIVELIFDPSEMFY